MKTPIVTTRGMNRLTDWSLHGGFADSPDCCRGWLAAIRRRQRGLRRALERRFRRGLGVVEVGFSGPSRRAPRRGTDRLATAESLAELLADRVTAFHDFEIRFE